ncbi:reverse transcriptase domain protein [Botrytis cinerea]
MRFKRETCSPTETTYQDKSNNNTVDCIGKSTAMADKDDDRPPKIPILDRKNWRQWFKMTKLHIVQKGWGYAITNNMAACRALHVNSGVAEFDEAIYKMEKAQAGAELFVIQHINDMDNELIEEITEFNAKWAKLEEKYKRVTPQELRNKFTRLTTWKLKDGVTAEEGWLEIYSIRKEIVEAEARQRDILTEDIVFGFFIQGLPERFNITIEAIDAQNLDFTTKFEKIRAVDETAALKKATALDSDGDTAMAMMAQSRGRQDRGGFDGNRRRSFDRRPRSSSRSKECFFCNESDHIARDCPHREGIKAYIKENPIKKSSSPPKNRTSSNWRNRESSPNSLSFRPARDRGYVAAEASDEDEVHHLPSESAYISFHGNTREWIADTGCSSHMTDQSHLLSSLKPLLTPRRIKVGGGELVAKEYGMVEIKWNEKLYKLKALHVPGLGASLLSARSFCGEFKAKGAFNDKKMYFHRNGKILLSANNFHGIYVIANTIKNDFDTAFPAEETEEEVPAELEDIIYDESKVDRAETQRRNRLNRYWLWHRRFGHMGYGILSKLHLVTTLEKDIKLPADLEPCEVCAATKMKKHYSTVLAEHKKRPLALISLDVSGPFPASFRKKRYFAEIICSWTRKTWIICLEKKSDIIIELEKWRIRVERESGFLVGATRTDNAPEIEKVLQEWQDKLGTQRQSTCIYTSNQNGTAERAIQTTQSNVRAMLKDSVMPVEFWDYAAESDAYTRNRTCTGPWVDEFEVRQRRGEIPDNQQRDVNMPARKRQVSPHEAWTGIVPSIAHIKMWGSKCYSHVDPASHPSGARRDKLMDRARIGVFVGYNDHTTKQLWIYAPDRHAVIKTSNCTFFEGSPGGKVDLKLRSVTSGGDFVEGQGIQNILPDRRPVGRPRIYPVASVRTMPIGTAEPEVATNVEESELEPITQLQSTTTPQVVIPQMTPQAESMDITTGEVEYAGPMTRKRSREQDNEADFQEAKRLRAFLAVMMDLEPDQEFFTKQQNDDYAFISEGG